MRISAWNVIGFVVLVWLIAQFALGGSSAGVSSGSKYALDANGNPDPNQHQPKCVSVRVDNARGWGSFDSVRSDVAVHGCNDSSGRLHLVSVTCSARSFLGPGTAACDTAQDGNRLKVVISVSYPLGLSLLAGAPNPSTFYIDPGGGYSTY